MYLSPYPVLLVILIWTSWSDFRFIDIYGGSNEDIAHAIIKTYDGGFAVIGNTKSNDIALNFRTTNDSDVMAIKHREHQLYGLQFHPESILTNYGMKIITNFLDEDKR